MKIADTHVHVWDLQRAAYPWLDNDQSILNRTWSIEELRDAHLNAGVSTGVLVQASGNPEDTELMFETARSTDWINGVVAWLPLTDTRATQQLLQEKFLEDEYFKGVRHQIHDERDAKWLLQPSVIKSLSFLAMNDIPFDVVAVKLEHIETALQVAALVPGLRMVFDHLAQPPIGTNERFGEWGVLMKKASDHSNFYAKISGLGTASGNFEGRTAAHIEPYIDFILDCFGVDRCFCGGDWPVSMMANDYVKTWQIYKDILTKLLAQKELEKVFYDNAVAFYKLTT